MTREEKIQQLLDKYSNEKQTNSVLEFSLVHKGEPKPYSRPRFTRFGRGGRGHCYNIRENYMNELKDSFLESMNIDHIAKINELNDNNLNIVTISSPNIEKLINELDVKLVSKDRNTIKFSNQLSYNELIKKLSKYDIEKLLIEEATIEDMFLNYYN